MDTRKTEKKPRCFSCKMNKTCMHIHPRNKRLQKWSFLCLFFFLHNMEGVVTTKPHTNMHYL